MERIGNRIRNLLPTRITEESSNQEIGDYGERMAAKHLKRDLGYKIVARNWRNPKNRNQEIDIIARDGEVLVFVEVKTQKGEKQVRAYYRAVNKGKKEALEVACKAYLRQKSVKAKHFRYDVAEVKLCQNQGNSVQIHKNVNLFSKHFHG